MRQVLQTIKSINPDENFIAKSRHEILSVARPSTGFNFYIYKIKTQLHESINFAAALALTALLVYVTSTGILNNNSKLAKETSNLNIELRNAQYYKKIAPDVYVVVLDKADSQVKDIIDSIVESEN